MTQLSKMRAPRPVVDIAIATVWRKLIRLHLVKNIVCFPLLVLTNLSLLEICFGVFFSRGLKQMEARWFLPDQRARNSNSSMGRLASSKADQNLRRISRAKFPILRAASFEKQTKRHTHFCEDTCLEPS